MRQAQPSSHAGGKPEHPPGEPTARIRRFRNLVQTLPSGTLPGRWTQTRSLAGTVTGQTFDLSGHTLPLSDQGLAGSAGMARLVRDRDRCRTSRC